MMHEEVPPDVPEVSVGLTAEEETSEVTAESVEDWETMN